MAYTHRKDFYHPVNNGKLLKNLKEGQWDQKLVQEHSVGNKSDAMQLSRIILGMIWV